MNVFHPKGGRQKREVTYRVLSAQKMWFIDDLCMHCRKQLPALVTAASLSPWPGALELLQAVPGCGAVPQEEALQDSVWVMLLHCRAEGLPYPGMSHQDSWHSQASSQLTALSHPSLGRGFGNAAAFSGCFRFLSFFTLLFSWNP